MSAPAIQQYNTDDGVIVLSNQAAPEQSQPTETAAPPYVRQPSEPPKKLDLHTEWKTLQAQIELRRAEPEPAGSEFSWELALGVVLVGLSVMAWWFWGRLRPMESANISEPRWPVRDEPLREVTTMSAGLGEDAAARPVQALTTPAPAPASVRRWASQPPPRS